MTSIEENRSGAEITFSSSVECDVWHPDKPPAGYEWWYFDALADGGREAIVVIFLDNFIFSPRYNAQNRALMKDPAAIPAPTIFPAVAFAYYRDGKPYFRSVTEYEPEDFIADPDRPSCSIGESNFRYDSAPYGNGYGVNVRADLSGGRTLRADLEWLSVESDLAPDPADHKVPGTGHCWNLVCPRSDVTGKMSVFEGGRIVEEVSFRGTGYHDHNLDTRWLPQAVREWNWGRLHFAGSTAVFYDFKGADPDEVFSKLCIVRDEEITEMDAVFEVSEYGRDKFGLKYPKRFKAHSTDGAELEVEQKSVVDSSFFYTRFLCEGVLSGPGIPTTRSVGISEYLAPASLKKGWFDPFIDMRISKAGKPSFLT